MYGRNRFGILFIVNKIINFVYYKSPADAHDRKWMILLLRSKCGRRNVNAKTKKVLSFTINNDKIKKHMETVLL